MTNVKYIVYGSDDPEIDAKNFSIEDAGGYYTGDNVEEALQEIGAGLDDFINGTPNFLGGLDAGSTGQLGIDVSGNLTTTGNIEGVHKAADGTAAVADGTYTMGLGTATNGTITIKDGIIVAVTECADA